MNELINKNMVLEARIEAILDDKKVLLETYCHFPKFATIVLSVSGCHRQGSHRSPKVLNVLEFDFSIRVPSNVLEFH